MSRSACSKTSHPRVDFDAQALNERLRTCSTLSDSERFEIQRTLQHAELDLADYDAQVHRIRLRRQGLKQYAERLATLLSPIRRLPNELLMRIFEECCKKNDLRFNAVGDALPISAVCNGWRDLSTSHPALWSCLVVGLGDPGEVNATVRAQTKIKMAARIDLYLRRSRTHALSLDFDDGTWSAGHDEEHPASRLLVQESYRWKYLTYRGYCFSEDHNPSLSRLDLPLLESLRFEDLDFAVEASQSPDTDAFEHAPNLTRIALQSVMVDQTTINAFAGRWGTLVELSYHTTGIFNMLWPILDLCPKLRRLALQGINFDQQETDRFSNPPRILPSVSSLVVTNERFQIDHDTLECIMSSLTIPNLAELTLEQIDGPTDRPVSQPYSVINSFLERSQCALTSLTLREVCLSEREMVMLLLRLPSLQELSIAEPAAISMIPHPISTSFIKSLHTWERNDLHSLVKPLVPRLRSLTLKVSTPAFEASSFVDTVASRWLPDEMNASAELGAACLRSVELHLPEIVEPEAYAPLIRLDTAGMRVVVKCAGREGYIV